MCRASLYYRHVFYASRNRSDPHFSMADPPSKNQRSGDVARFLQKQRAISRFVQRNPRLMFAIDATASRQPTWDMACHLQGEMFSATAPIAELSVQLCFYRGFPGLPGVRLAE